MRNGVGEKKLQELNEFFKSRGVQNYHSTMYEQIQNGLAESFIFSHLKQELIEKYSLRNILNEYLMSCWMGYCWRLIRGNLMETFLGMQVQ